MAPETAASVFALHSLPSRLPWDPTASLSHSYIIDLPSSWVLSSHQRTNALEPPEFKKK